MRLGRVKELNKRLNFSSFLKIVFLEFIQRAFLPGSKYYFSQEGEDIKILSLLQKSKDGFYIDIGSNDPISNSNTFKLYLMGWNGILVDGNSKLIDRSKQIRKKDICLHAVVSNVKKTLKFYIAQDHLMSSVDSKFAKYTSAADYIPPAIDMETVTLNEIIDQHLPAGKKIDFLSIDVEGHDFEVLESIDLNRYRPSLIVIEDLHHFDTPIENNVFLKYLKEFNYHLISRDKLNLYFIEG